MEDEVQLEDYDVRWPEKFAVEAVRIRDVFGEANVIAVEHFGSTAIPGLVAKPIIDLLVIVHSLAEAKNAVEPMHSLGYAYWYDNPRQDRLFFVKGLPPNGPRTHHVHVTEPRGEMAETRLPFRDYLRTHDDARDAYASLKRELASRHQSDREAYTEAKADFVNGIVAKAHQEQTQTPTTEFFA
jgi:GrpB-like predicted nucleotidyltransferase (UPF0157 family)